jgi:hypothetical protein
MEAVSLSLCFPGATRAPGVTLDSPNQGCNLSGSPRPDPVDLSGYQKLCQEVANSHNCSVQLYSRPGSKLKPVQESSDLLGLNEPFSSSFGHSGARPNQSGLDAFDPHFQVASDGNAFVHTASIIASSLNQAYNARAALLRLNPVKVCVKPLFGSRL